MQNNAMRCREPTESSPVFVEHPPVPVLLARAAPRRRRVVKVVLFCGRERAVDGVVEGVDREARHAVLAAPAVAAGRGHGLELAEPELDGRDGGEREVGHEALHVRPERVRRPEPERLREVARVVVDAVRDVLLDQGHHPERVRGRERAAVRGRGREAGRVRVRGRHEARRDRVRGRHRVRVWVARGDGECVEEGAAHRSSYVLGR
ncbi:hypothetical protein C8Q80DRAFT_341779 [Daedaleopsis nitida]|nr:hypothetical protein C8Q80DRAFT_341779 [Daedaleopsis nitida]